MFTIVKQKNEYPNIVGVHECRNAGCANNYPVIFLHSAADVGSKRKSDDAIIFFLQVKEAKQKVGNPKLVK